MKRTKLITAIKLFLFISIPSLAQAEVVEPNLNTAKTETRSQLQKREQSLSTTELELYQQLNFNSADTKTKRSHRLSNKHTFNAPQRNFGNGYGSGYGSRQARN